MTHKGSKNLLFTPALYSSNSHAAVMLISVLAGAKRTSPSVMTFPLTELVLRFPSPKVTTKIEGPETAGNTANSP